MSKKIIKFVFFILFLFIIAIIIDSCKIVHIPGIHTISKKIIDAGHTWYYTHIVASGHTHSHDHHHEHEHEHEHEHAMYEHDHEHEHEHEHHHEHEHEHEHHHEHDECDECDECDKCDDDHDHEHAIHSHEHSEHEHHHAHDDDDEDEHKHAVHSHADHEHDEHSHSHAEHEHSHNHSHAPAVVLNDTQKKLLNIKTAKATTGKLERTLRFNGEIHLNLDETAKLMPRIPGFVTHIFVKEGDQVKKGQILARLSSQKLGEYYSDYNSATELESLTLAEFTMAQNLRSRNALSEQEYLRYKREYADAVIARRRAKALLNSLLLETGHEKHSHFHSSDTEQDHSKINTQDTICTEYDLCSPLDGTIIEKNITIGESFSEDNTQVLFVVSNLNHIWVDLRANNIELRMLSIGTKVSIIPANSTETYKGQIIYISPLIDEETRTGVFRVLVDNSKGKLRAGDFAVGTITTNADKSVLIPRSSVQIIQGETVVFIPDQNGYSTKVIATEDASKGMIQVTKGLNAGDFYVVSGAFELKSMLITAGMDPHAGHGH